MNQSNPKARRDSRNAIPEEISDDAATEPVAELDECDTRPIQRQPDRSR